MIGKFIIGEVTRRVAGEAIDKGLGKAKKAIVGFLTEEETKQKISELETKLTVSEANVKELSGRLQRVQSVVYSYTYGMDSSIREEIINAAWGK